MASKRILTILTAVLASVCANDPNPTGAAVDDAWQYEWVNAVGEIVLPVSYSWGSYARKRLGDAHFRGAEGCNRTHTGSSGLFARQDTTCTEGYVMSCPPTDEFPCCPERSPICCPVPSTVCCATGRFCQGNETCCDEGTIGCGEACCDAGQTCCGTTCCQAGFTCSAGTCVGGGGGEDTTEDDDTTTTTEDEDTTAPPSPPTTNRPDTSPNTGRPTTRTSDGDVGTNTNTPDGDEDEDSGSSNAAVIGGAVGGTIGGLVLIGLIVLLVLKKRKKHGSQEQIPSSYAPSHNPMSPPPPGTTPHPYQYHPDMMQNTTPAPNPSVYGGVATPTPPPPMPGQGQYAQYDTGLAQGGYPISPTSAQPLMAGGFPQSATSWGPAMTDRSSVYSQGVMGGPPTGYAPPPAGYAPPPGQAGPGMVQSWVERPSGPPQQGGPTAYV